MKRPLPKVYDPKEDVTHIMGPDGLDQATLCGQTDWLGQETPDYHTDRPVDCGVCKQVF